MGTPITLQNLLDAATDVATLATVVNSTAASVVTRQGTTVPTLTQALATISAASGQVGVAALASVLSSLPLPGNLFDVSSCFPVDSYINYLTGEVLTQAGFGTQTSAFMPANAAGSMWTNLALSTDQAASAYAFYDGSGTFISSNPVNVTPNSSFSVPPTAVFIRVCVPASFVSNLMIGFGTAEDIPASYQAFGGVTLNQVAAAATEVATNNLIAQSPSNYNYFNPNGVSPSTLLYTGLIADGHPIGSTTTAYSGYYTSDYMPVLPGRTYTMALPMVEAAEDYGIVWYDALKNPISAAAIPFTAGETFTAPVGAYYVRFCGDNSTLAYQMWTLGVNVPPSYVPQQPDAVTYSALLGKKFAVFGDSISGSFSDEWQNDVTALTGMTLGLNDSMGGRPLNRALECYGGGTGTGVNRVITATGSTFQNNGTLGNTLAQDLAGHDICFLFLGTNDYNVGPFVMGELGDPVGTASEYGYARDAIEGILAAAPSIRLMIITPQQNYQETYDQVLGIVVMFQTIGSAYGIPVLNWLAEGGNNFLTTQILTRDFGTPGVVNPTVGTHPSYPVGMLRLAEMISRFAQRYF